MEKSIERQEIYHYCDRRRIMKTKKMKWSRKILLLIVASFQLLSFVQAQDLHFSQFFNSPLTANPANTGFIPDADYRIGTLFRNQWSSILTNPYKTFSVYGDAQVLRDKLENGWLGLGAVILSDVVGSGSLRTTEVYGSLAYHQMLGSSSLLSAGFNLGWANKRIDESKLTFPDQFNQTFFDATLPTAVILSTNSVSYFDMQVGMNYAYFPDENTYIHFGYSIYHVNRPVETFFSDNPDSSRIPMRHIVFADAILKASNRVIINPNAYFTVQAKSTEFMLGMTANYNLSEAGEKQFIIGLYDRFGDAVVPMVGFELNHVRFTFSYDVTTSALNDFNNSEGASEFNVLKKGFYNTYNGNQHQSLCPQF
jgi:type IX secretion system PorP/SprF family membrane protein